MDQSTQHYTVMARRFRPQTFSEVVGQEHVGQAITNAIRSGRVAHAYLFTGARGVGKTSTARIFAKALNCPQSVEGVPCNRCDTCQSIAAGSDVDVLEIDGASNRGIDDIRQLRANVNVRSMRSPNKVYIIDEVHMLTKEAFNALLKTLEEPPANVKFVFCTTEPNKVPETILSRCQRFDFGTIATNSIRERLRQIADAEGRHVDDEALDLVARRAAGSMRDSQSLFDQLLAFGNEHVTAADVHQLLGTAPDDLVHDLVASLITRNHASALEKLDEAFLQGVQLGNLSDQLLAYFRDMLVLSVGAQSVPLSAVSENFRPQIQQQATTWGLESIANGMQILADAKSRMQRVTHGRALLELALVRIGQLEQLSVLGTLIAGLKSGDGASTPKAAPASVHQVSASRRIPVAAVPSGDVKSTGMEEGTNRTKTGETHPVSQAAPITPSSPGKPEQESEKVHNTLQTIELSASEASPFWQSLIAEASENLAGHLKNVSTRAISGPNSIELLFPKSYLFSKSYCERPETTLRVNEIASRLTGRKITVQFKTEENSSPLPPREVAEPEKAVERRKATTVDQDQFVQAALAIFGGEVVDVRALEAPSVVEEH